MQLETGKIYEGKVTGITKFGAFVEIDGKTTGMVHISEVANTFVNEIKDHLQEGQVVKVKVLGITDEGKVSLSIKKAQEPAVRPQRTFNKPFNQPRQQSRPQNFTKPDLKSQPPMEYAPKQDRKQDNSFEDMLSKFKQNSDEKISDLKKNIDGKRKSTSRRAGSKS